MTESNRRWRHIRNAAILALVVSILALAVAAVGTLAGLAAISRTERTAVSGVENVRDGERASCARVQRLRGQSNQVARIIYTTLDLVNQSASSRGSRFAELYGDLAQTVTFTPPTDCIQAVDFPRTYVPPQPIRFADCKSPPPPDFSGCPHR